MLTPSDAQLAQRDPVIPDLATLLNPDAVSQALQKVLPKTRLGEIRPLYVRYKPATNCIVSYLIELDGITTDIYFKAFMSGSRDKIEKMRNKALSTSPGQPKPIVLGDALIFTYIFPNDKKLKALLLFIDPAKRPTLLKNIVPTRPDLWDSPPDRLRYKPERRYVEKLKGSDGHPLAVLKAYIENGYHDAKKAALAFTDGDTLKIPALLGRSDEHRVLVFEWRKGRSLNELLDDKNIPVTDLEILGKALAELHLQNVGDLPVLSRESEAASLEEQRDSLTYLCPHLRETLKNLTSQLTGRLLKEPPRQIPIHGDFYADQVLIDDDRATILDFDRAGLGDPATDLGNFFAHIIRAAFPEDIDSNRLELMKQSLLKGYQPAMGKDCANRIGLYTAIGLFRLAVEPFRQRKPDWPQKIARILKKAREVLEAFPTPSLRTGKKLISTSNIPVSDPYNLHLDLKMGPLVKALDPDEIERRFNEMMASKKNSGGKIQVRAIRVIRLKPSRRCLIEYDVLVNFPDAPPRKMTWIGKIRARGLDQATYDLQLSLWENAFSGDSEDEVSVPEPLGTIPELRMWVYRKVPGLRVTEQLTGAGGIQLAKKIARALCKLHSEPSKTERTHTIADELKILHERLPLVLEKHPEWEQRVQRLLDSCDRLAAQLPRQEPVGIHRDFYPDQLYAEDNHLYLLDWDLYCRGDRALDAGNFLGHLTEQSLRVLGNKDGLMAQEKAFQEEFLRLSDKKHLETSVKTYTTLTLVRHIYISTLFPDRRACTEPLLEICENRLGLGSEVLRSA